MKKVFQTGKSFTTRKDPEESSYPVSWFENGVYRLRNGPIKALKYASNAPVIFHERLKYKAASFHDKKVQILDLDLLDQQEDRLTNIQVQWVEVGKSVIMAQRFSGSTDI